MTFSLKLDDPETKVYVLNNLCYHDLRNTNHLYNEYGETDTPTEKPINCTCDNCFYGRTKLAEKLLEHLENNA